MLVILFLDVARKSEEGQESSEAWLENLKC